MKKLAILSLALGLAAGAFAQGSVIIDNGGSGFPNFTLDGSANLFSGTYGLQVYMMNGSTVPGNINSFSGVNSSQAYANMLAAGYTLEKSFVNQTITAANAGSFALGSITMADVTPAGGNVVIALVAWTGSGASFGTAVGVAKADGGVITFANPTGNPNAVPPGLPVNLTGWKALGTDLAMTPVPEPGTFALAGLGAAALMAIRRRK